MQALSPRPHALATSRDLAPSPLLFQYLTHIPPQFHLASPPCLFPPRQAAAWGGQPTAACACARSTALPAFTFYPTRSVSHNKKSLQCTLTRPWPIRGTTAACSALCICPPVSRFFITGAICCALRTLLLLTQRRKLWSIALRQLRQIVLFNLPSLLPRRNLCLVTPWVWSACCAGCGGSHSDINTTGARSATTGNSSHSHCIRALLISLMTRSHCCGSRLLGCNAAPTDPRQLLLTSIKLATPSHRTWTGASLLLQRRWYPLCFCSSLKQRVRLFLGD